MRIWSLSLKYLDTKGLVALWREALLAKKVLEGQTKGYKYHPQLNRFKDTSDPILMINAYIGFIYDEANYRNYKFDKAKFIRVSEFSKIKVSRGQIEYEFEHLKRKLEKRSPKDLDRLPMNYSEVQVVPIFEMVDGDVEIWEIQN